ncbi:MAG: heme-binding protein [Marinomonas sp.]
MKRILAWVAAALGVAALGAVFAAAQYRETIEEPAHKVVARGEGIELRDYTPMIVAEVTVEGDRRKAPRAGFQRLAAYIFAQDRPGAAQDEGDEKIAMTSPVMQNQSEKIAMTSPVMQDSAKADGTESSDGPWRTRFVMPSKYTMESLPQTPEDIILSEVPGRRMAAIMFSGMGSKTDLAQMETMLRSWMKAEGHKAAGPVEYAFYDGPWVPARFRRNEVMIPVVKAQ